LYMNSLLNQPLIISQLISRQLSLGGRELALYNGMLKNYPAFLTSDEMLADIQIDVIVRKRACTLVNKGCK